MGAVLSLVERLTRYVGRPLAFRVEAPLLLAVWSVFFTHTEPGSRGR